VAYAVLDPYKAAIRGDVRIDYVVDAYFAGVPVLGAQALPVTSGSITDTTKPGVRRNLSCEIAPDPGLYDRLKQPGTQLKASAVVTYTNRVSVTIPMGVFVVQKGGLRTGGGSISINAPDKWVLLQRAKFIGPTNSTPGSSITAQIATLITGALPGETVAITSVSTASVGTLTWPQDREKAILDMAASAALWVYFDRTGNPVVADLPAPGPTADWLSDASQTGVLLELDREFSFDDVSNVVVVSSSAADEEKFPPQVAWDQAVGSPTYAGTDPFANPASAGPFGISVKYLDTPTDTDANGALAAAQAELTRSIAPVQTVSLEQTPNPAADAYDTIDVLPLPERRDLAVSTERFIIDELSHPMTPGGTQGQSINGRKAING
jgi:hypothetical protein